jgi:acyl carrier protein
MQGESQPRPIEHMTGIVTRGLCEALNLAPDVVTPRTILSDIGLDSLGLAAILGRVEAAYGCEFSSEQILELFQAERVEDLVAGLLRARQ